MFRWEEEDQTVEIVTVIVVVVEMIIETIETEEIEVDVVMYVMIFVIKEVVDLGKVVNFDMIVKMAQTLFSS